MKQTVDVESQLYKINLRHGDTHPRNVMIQAHDIELSEPRFKLIDFRYTIIGRSLSPQNEDLERDLSRGSTSVYCLGD